MEAKGNPGGCPAAASKTPTSSDLPSRDQREHRPSLYLLLLFLIFAAGIITAGYLFYRSYARNFRGEVERGLSSIAELKVGQLVRWRKERFMDASFLYRNPAFSALVSRYLRNPADAGAYDGLYAWLENYTEYYQYDRAFLFDARGVERMSAPETPNRIASVISRRASEILRSGQPVIQDFYRDENDGKIYLSVLAPIFDEQERDLPLGVIVLRIDPATYLYPFIQQWPTRSRTAETLLVRREGDEALFLNEIRFRKDSALSLRVPLDKGDRTAVKAALGQEGIVEGNDYRGVPVVADVRGIPDSPWFLVARMDTTEALAPVRARLWLMIGLVAVLLFGTGASVGLIWRQQRLRFFRERLAAVKRTYAVSSRQEALLSAVPDIIMEVDQNKVYTWANPAGIKFFGEDVVGKEAAFYFEGEQETYQKVEPLFNGHDDVIYIESWQRRKDGEKRLLAWWCRVLKDDGGRVIGAISSAQDITEHKRAEEAIVRAAKEWETTFDAANDAIWLLDKEQRVVRSNKRAERLFQRPCGESVGKHCWEIVHGTAQPIPKCPILRARNSLHRESTELQIGEGWFEVTVDPILDAAGRYAGSVHIVSDITERKRDEETIQRQLDEITSYYDNAPIGLAVLDTDLRFLRINNMLAEINGIPAVEHIGKTVKEIVPTLEAQARKVTSEIIRTGKPIKDLEFSGETAAEPGVKRLFMESWLPIKSDSEKIAGFAVIVQDITERKRAEESLREEKALSYSIIENMPAGIAFLDNDFVLRKYNRAYAALIRTYTPYSPEEALGMSYFDYVPGSREQVKEWFTTVRDSGRSETRYGFKLLIKGDREEATYWDASIAPVLGSAGNVEGILILTQDVTERKRAEEEIQSLARFPSENPNPVLRIARDGTLLYSNQAGLSLLPEWHLQVGQAAPPMLREAAFQVMDSGSTQMLDLECRQRVYSFFLVPVVGADYANLYGRDVTERRQAEEALRESESRLRALSAELTLSEENERYRLALFLHDEIGQSLALLRMKFGSFAGVWESKSGKQNIQQIRDLLEKVIDQTHTLTFELSPPVLHQLGLEAAIEWAGEKISQDFGIGFMFSDDGMIKPLSADIKALLFRCVRELMMNIVKHAKARRMTVSLTRTEERVVVVVEDDGIGFDSSLLDRQQNLVGFGLFSVRERLGAVGGSYELQSAPGRGTRLTLSVPLNEEKPAT